VRSVLAGNLLVSVPYGTYGGILSDDQAVQRALAAEAVRLADRREACSLELRSTSGGVEGMVADERYARFARPLPLRVEELATYLPRKARAAVRQAQAREGLTVQHDTALLRIVWDLYTRSMRRLASINSVGGPGSRSSGAMGARSLACSPLCSATPPIPTLSA
jgi:hypothetical protein